MLDPAERVSRIPQEIWDQIISLTDDQATLRACSLTCRSWVHVSQSQLFSDPVEEKGPSMDDNLMDALVCVLSASPHLRTYVTVLSTTTSFINLFGELCLPNVRIVHVWESDSTEGNFSMWTTLWARSPLLQGVHIHNFFFGPHEFVLLIRSLPSITCLGLHELSWEGEEDEAEPDDPSSVPGLPARLCLTQLEVEGGNVDGAMKHLLCLSSSGDIILSLNTLALDVAADPGWLTVANALLQQCSMLLSLRITNYAYLAFYETELDEPFNFCMMHAMREITIHMHQVAKFQFALNSLQHLANSLRTVRSQAFRSLTLILQILSEEEEETALNDFLAKFRTTLCDECSTWSTELHIRFPRHSHQTGLVHNMDSSVEEHLGALTRCGVVVRQFR